MHLRPTRAIFPAVVAIAASATLSLAPSGVAGARAPQAHAQRLPVLANGNGHSAVRPTTIVYTGDGSGLIGMLPSSERHAVGQRPGFLHWTAWTNTHANADGTVWLLSCRPSCAASPYYRYALSLTVGRVRHGHFTRMTLHYTYHGQQISDTRCVSDRPPAQIWGFVDRGRCD
jgi:hypothetical protein